MSEREAYIAFNLTEKVGSVKVGELARAAGSVAAAWEAYPKKTARSGGEVDWNAELKRAAKFGVEVITPADEAYPQRLRDAPGRPLALYVKGDVKALSLPAVAIVGTRRATAYGLDQAFRFGRDLAEAGWCVVSGLALGIDAEAHKGALAGKGVTVGVIGSGLDQFYPEQNRDLAREIVRAGGAVVSEFPFGRPPDQQTFPQRNHVVAGLVAGVVAIEAPVKSGTLITTGIAADLGRTVMAVPGRVDSRSSAGCLSLIRDGAVLVRSARDVAEALSELILGREEGKGKREEEKGKREEDVESQSRQAAPLPYPETQTPTNPKTKQPDSSPLPKFSIEEALVMKHVDAEGISMDELVRRTKLPAAKINSVCMTLRVKGRIRFFPGNRVALPREA